MPRTPGPWDRLYRTSRWAKISKMNLKRNPLCTRCTAAGRTHESELSHHIEAWRPGFAELNFWYGPLDALCFDCHAEVHGRPARLPYQRDIGSDGFPIDSQHPFWLASDKIDKREDENK